MSKNDEKRQVKKGDIHSIPVAGHESHVCPHCDTEKIEITSDHHYLPVFTILCQNEECLMETSYEQVYLVCQEPKKRLD